MACPTQLLNGRCWTLGRLGQSCADACGGSQNVDVEALDDASSSATIDHLEALYGCHTTSRDGADRWCGPPAEAMFAFIPLGFSNFGGEGRWHCLHGESYTGVTENVRSPCVCTAASRAVSARPPLRSAQHLWGATPHALFYPPHPPPPPSPPGWSWAWWDGGHAAVSDRAFTPTLHWEMAQLGGGANQELLLLVAALLVLFGLIGCLEFKPQDWLRGCTRCCARSYARGCACMARGCACVTRQRAPWRPFVGARRLSQESPSRRASRSPRKPEALRESRSPRRPSTPQGFHSSPRKPSRPHSWNPCGWLRRWLRGWRCCGSLRGWRCCGWLRGCTCPTLPLVGTRGLVGSSHAGRWHNHGLFIDGRGGGGGGSAGDRWRWRRPSPVASEGARAQYRQSDEALKHSQQALARSEQALSSAYRGARSLGARSLTPAGMPTLKPHTRVDRLAASSGRDFRPKSPKAQQKGRSKGRLSTVQL